MRPRFLPEAGPATIALGMSEMSKLNSKAESEKGSAVALANLALTLILAVMLPSTNLTKSSIHHDAVPAMVQTGSEALSLQLMQPENLTVSMTP